MISVFLWMKGRCEDILISPLISISNEINTIWAVGGIKIGANNEQSRLFGKKIFGKPIRYFLVVQDI